MNNKIDSNLILIKYIIIISIIFVLAACGAKQPAIEKYKSYSEAEQNIDQAFQQGLQFGKQGYHKDALRQFKISIQHNPDFAEGYRNAGIALVFLDQVDEAIQYYEKAIHLDPRNAIAYINLAVAQGLVGKVEAGLESYRQAIEIDPELSYKWAHVELNLQDLQDNFVPAKDVESPIAMPGFSIKPPKGNRWQMKSESTGTNIVFVRSTGRGEEHTAVASAKIIKIAPNTDFPQRLSKAVEYGLQQFEDSRYENLHFDLNDIQKNGASCRQLSFVVDDHGVPYALGKKFIMNGAAIYCEHPSSNWPVILELHYSQRYLYLWQPLSLEKEIDTFVESVKLRDPSPLDYIQIYGLPSYN